MPDSIIFEKNDDRPAWRKFPFNVIDKYAEWLKGVVERAMAQKQKSPDPPKHSDAVLFLSDIYTKGPREAYRTRSPRDISRYLDELESQGLLKPGEIEKIWEGVQGIDKMEKGETNEFKWEPPVDKPKTDKPKTDSPTVTPPVRIAPPYSLATTPVSVANEIGKGTPPLTYLTPEQMKPLKEKDPQTEELQRLLASKGIAVKVDGWFGDETAKAVQEFSVRYGMNYDPRNPNQMHSLLQALKASQRNF